jgi:hypothetical protein
MNKILNLKEFISVLDSVSNKNLPLFFDVGDGVYPTGFSSWRGNYGLLAIVPSVPNGGCSNFYQNRHDAEEYKNGFSSALPENTVRSFIEIGRNITGKWMVGWKGGEYQVDDSDELYVSAIGKCDGIETGKEVEGDWSFQQIIGIEELEGVVVIKTVYHNKL